jgi:hypothetical protein
MHQLDNSDLANLAINGLAVGALLCFAALLIDLFADLSPF